MSFRKIDIRNTNKPSAVPSWDKSGIGPEGILPIKYAGKVNSVEVERAIFREVMDAIKEVETYVVDNLPESPPAMIYRWPANDGDPKKHVFAVCVYPRFKPAQYFMILERLSYKLRVIIDKVMRDAQKNTSVHGQIQPNWNTVKSQLRPTRKPGHSPNSWGKGPHRKSSSTDKSKDAPVQRTRPKTTNRAVPSHPWRTRKG